MIARFFTLLTRVRALSYQFKTNMNLTSMNPKDKSSKRKWGSCNFVVMTKAENKMGDHGQLKSGLNSAGTLRGKQRRASVGSPGLSGTSFDEAILSQEEHESQDLRTQVRAI